MRAYDDSVDLVGDQQIEVFAFLFGGMQRVAEDHLVPTGVQFVFYLGGYGREEGMLHVGYDKTDQIGLVRVQAPRNLVGLVV